ncbi:MAG: DUF2182 domain-containing protein [Chromatiales bacterium]
MAPALELLLKRDRWLMTAGLALIVLLAWGYLLAGAGMGMNGLDMTRMYAGQGMTMQPSTWTLGYAVLMFLMWWIMMTAMMLPGAAPTILLAAAVNRKAQPERGPYGASGFFTLGYLIVWAFFSLLAVAAQWGLTEYGILSPTMVRSTSPVLAGGLLIAAGVWQFTPLKQACLRHCRSPIQFLVQRRRNGNAGCLAMGMEHGTYCLGCCWFMMALLFVGGVMNLYWVVGLAFYVWAEKMLPAGQGLRRVAGVALLLWGIAVSAGAV